MQFSLLTLLTSVSAIAILLGCWSADPRLIMPALAVEVVLANSLGWFSAWQIPRVRKILLGLALVLYITACIIPTNGVAIGGIAACYTVVAPIYFLFGESQNNDASLAFIVYIFVLGLSNLGFFLYPASFLIRSKKLRSRSVWFGALFLVIPAIVNYRFLAPLSNHPRIADLLIPFYLWCTSFLVWSAHQRINHELAAVAISLTFLLAWLGMLGFFENLL